MLGWQPRRREAPATPGDLAKAKAAASVPWRALLTQLLHLPGHLEAGFGNPGLWPSCKAPGTWRV